MKSSLETLVCLLCFALAGVAADDAKPAPANAGGPVRLKFVPAKKGESGGASWTKLHSSPITPGTLWAHANAGIGDTFPIGDETERKLFEVTVTDGDDNALVVEVRWTEGKDRKEVAQKAGLARDQPTDVKVGEHTYELLFPTLTVNPDAKTTTNTAMIIVKRVK
jgi:hypothetical protein